MLLNPKLGDFFGGIGYERSHLGKKGEILAHNRKHT